MNNLMIIFQNKYFVNLVVGIATAVFILLIQKLFSYLKNAYTYKKYKGFVGRYHTYAYSTNKKTEISSFSYDIKYKFGQLKVHGGNSVLSYIGNLSITDKNLYLSIKGCLHQEQLLMIFHKPLHNQFDELIGVISCVSVINEPTSKIILMSKNELDLEVAKNILKTTELKGNYLYASIPLTEATYTNNLPTNHPAYDQSTKSS